MRRFLNAVQCQLFVVQQPSLYPTAASRVAFVCTLLTGKALEWATAVWREDGSAFPTFEHFLSQFRAVFEHSATGESAEERLLAVSQGDRPAAEYALTFRTLAAETGWEERPLTVIYRKGLYPDLQAELTCRDEGRDLMEFIDLSICIDNLMRTRRPPTHAIQDVHETLRTARPADPEPMQLEATHLMPEEEAKRFRFQLCLYCGEAGHRLAACPNKPPGRQNTSVSPDPRIPQSSNCAVVQVQVEIQGKIICPC
ncbi:juxtaposed with another zinc finger protein 1a isoform X1 [Tachysurus fulvidraco]|uniref:juxtaposed with another zinc finger protein 1a isoform X1 n=1 Tax=Tachysurus fulvidraco TaxID=1234273 RepID=UPI001FF04C68|nr:juxtaposed with another zinc finger protein 1a isoform X1 [Tachysurus fulvidraco]